jgi:hypothetical protein
MPDKQIFHFFSRKFNQFSSMKKKEKFEFRETSNYHKIYQKKQMQINKLKYRESQPKITTLKLKPS